MPAFGREALAAGEKFLMILLILSKKKYKNRIHSTYLFEVSAKGAGLNGCIGVTPGAGGGFGSGLLLGYLQFVGVGGDIFEKALFFRNDCFHIFFMNFKQFTIRHLGRRVPAIR